MKNRNKFLLGWAMILFSNTPNNWQTKTGDNPWSNAPFTAEILKFSFLLSNLGISGAPECLRRWISKNYWSFSSFTPKQVTNLKWWWSMTKCTLYNTKTKKRVISKKIFMSFSYPTPPETTYKPQNSDEKHWNFHSLGPNLGIYGPLRGQKRRISNNPLVFLFTHPRVPKNAQIRYQN